MTGSPVLNAEQITQILEQSFASARTNTNEQLTALEASLREALAETDRRVDELPEAVKEGVRKYLSTLEKAYREAFSKWVSWREDFKKSSKAHFERFQQELADLLTEQQRLAASVHDAGLAFGKDVAALRENLETTFNENQHRIDALSLGTDSNGRDIQDLNKQVEALVEERLALAASLSQSLEDINIGLEACGTRDEKLGVELAKVDADFRAVADEWATFAALVSDLRDLCSSEFEDFHEHRRHVSARLEGFAQMQESDRQGIDRSRTRLDEHMQLLADFQAVHTELASRLSELHGQVEGISEYMAERDRETTRELAAKVTVEQAETFAPAEELQTLQEKLLALALQVDANKGEAHTDIADRFEAAADEFLGLQQRIERRVENIAATLSQSIANVRDWQSDGPPYWANSVVRYRGGIWIATRETTGTPGESPDWNLLFEGIDWVDVGADGTRLALNLRTSSGAETEFNMDLPSFAFHGTWSADKIYKARDTVMHDGHRWVALRDDPQGEPSESEHWRLFAMRGPRGRKGDRGPPGETPAMKDFLTAWRDHLDVADGTPVMRFRGAWSFEKAFAAGDVVSYEKSLYIAVTDREASFDPPTVTQDSGWAMFSPYRTVGAGALVREVEGQTGF